jgi:hypothetical protein
MSRSRIDLTGKRFGKWLVDSFDRMHKGASYWLCVCDCGQTHSVMGSSLTYGSSTSCGCVWKDIAAAQGKKNTTHGKTITPEYQIWQSMLIRCRDKENPNYGGRGIQVCNRWNPAAGGSFENFLSDLGPRPAGVVGRRPLYSLDRYPDNDGDYTPSNCRWATPKQQRNNQRELVHPNSKKTHCPRGHALVEGNLVQYRLPHRICLACRRSWHVRRAKQARKAVR